MNEDTFSLILGYKRRKKLLEEQIAEIEKRMQTLCDHVTPNNDTAIDEIYKFRYCIICDKTLGE